MLDLKIIRQNPDMIKKAMKDRNKDMDSLIDNILEIDEKRRGVTAVTEAKKAEQNKASKLIPQYKKEGKDVSELLGEMKTLSDTIKELDDELRILESAQQDILYSIPNIQQDDVPVGTTEEDNREVRKYGEPKQFEYEPKAHWDIGANLNILDPVLAAKVTGARFHFLKGKGARLERSVYNFFLNTHTEHGYTEIFPPYMANKESMTATGQLPKFGEDMFKIEGLDYYLIPTAEVPVTNMHRDEIIEGSKLPISYCAYSACFRAEGGSAGRDTRGLIRQHQFNKVELVKFTKPEDSNEALERITSDAERVLQMLGLPYRVVCLCTGDLSFASTKTYDIEVWMPSYGKYVEISSCSNFQDFQARRGAIRYKDNIKDKAQLVHTLNGSGVAIGRAVAAILENYQNDDGSVTVPEVLRPYMGCDVISKEMI